MLDGLSCQTFTDFETIVIIDGSTDSTEEYIHSSNWKLGNLVVSSQENKGRAGARNSGARIANGDYLIFFDDDVIPDIDLIQNYYNAFNEGNEVLVGRLTARYENANNEYALYSDYLNKKWDSTIFNNTEIATEQPYITANNFGIKKSVFRSVDGFDERLRDAEDFDLSLRLKTEGVHIKYSENLVAQHLACKNFGEHIERMVEYSMARKDLIDINEDAKTHFQKSTQKLSFLKKAILWFLHNKIWVTIIDLQLLTFLNKSIRFRLYDAVLTSYLVYG